MKNTELRKDAANLKAELDCYHRRLTKQVESYSVEVREQREQMEATWSSTRKQLSATTGTEVIDKYKGLDEKLEQTMPLQYEAKPQLSKMYYIRSPTLSRKFYFKSIIMES